MLVVGGDAADAGVEADAVVVAAGASQLGLERGRVADLFEVGVLGVDVPEEGLDPGLVSGGAGPSEALGGGSAYRVSAGVALAVWRW